MSTGKARRISLCGLAKVGVVLCCGMAYASPVGDAIGPYVDGGELPGAVSVVVDAKGKAIAARIAAICTAQDQERRSNSPPHNFQKQRFPLAFGGGMGYNHSRS